MENMKVAYKMLRQKRILLISPLLILSFYLCVCMMNYQQNTEEIFSTRAEIGTQVTKRTEKQEILAEEIKGVENEDVQNNRDIVFRREMEDAESANSKRLDRVQAVCKKYNLGLYKNSQRPSEIKHPPTPQYSVFYFDRIHKWSLCPIYKAGSSTWLYNMLMLAGVTEDEIDNSGKQLSEIARQWYPELDPSAAEEEFRTSTKILTVRHPFERLLSAYRDKLENINYGGEHGTIHYYRAYGSKIVKKYRAGGNNTKSSTLLKKEEYFWDPKHPEPAGVEPTFQEFVRYLIDSNIVAAADDHWIPYYLFCTPCLLQYDFIANLETFGRDQSYIIRALGLHEKIKARWRHKTQFKNDHDGNKPSTVAQFYFRQLTSSQITQLHEKFRIDFELFGYSFQEYLIYAKDSAVEEQ